MGRKLLLISLINEMYRRGGKNSQPSLVDYKKDLQLVTNVVIHLYYNLLD